MRKLLLILPISIVIFAVFLFLNIDVNLSRINLTSKPIPNFSVKNLFDDKKNITNKEIPKHYFLVNFWGSWCQVCAEEWPLLMNLKNQGIIIWGVAYRDKLQHSQHFISQLGNPFKKVMFDPDGRFAMELGVIGTPETYLIDDKGNIQLRYTGILSADIWNTQFAPYFIKEK